MDSRLLDRLRVVTQEEQAFLNGKKTIDRQLYMQGADDTVNSRKLLAAGKLITIRPHTRFIDFPEHRHDFVEVVYMCSGQTVHRIEGKQIVVKQGELLFMSQNTAHSIQKAGIEDVGINFIVLPEFFTESLRVVEEQNTPIRQFLTDSLCRLNAGPGYLHFQVADVPPVQNLVENLLWILLEETVNKRRTAQMTMALLFMQLLGYTDKMSTDGSEEAAILKLLRYLEANYARCSLSDAAKELHYDPNWLSREIKRKTGKTYTQLVQEKRLAQAAFLIRNTDGNIADIAVAVGYENISYFHRIFAASFGKSPKHYRDN